MLAEFVVYSFFHQSDDSRIVCLFKFFQSIQGSIDFRFSILCKENIENEFIVVKPLFLMYIDGKYVSGKNSQKPFKIHSHDLAVEQ